MKVVLIELRKLFSSRIFLLIIASTFVLNGYLMFRTANSHEVKPSDYKEVYSAMEGLSDEEKLNWLDARILEFSGQHHYNFEALYELRDECYNVVHYKEYLENIKTRAKYMTNVSLFAKPDTFNYRCVIKTPPAYENVQNVQPKFDVSRGVILATDNSFTDILIGFVLLFAVLSVMLSDREQGMTTLLFSMKRGRGYLLSAKIVALAITLLVGIMIIYIENLMISSMIYGLGELSRPIQSVQGFIGCNLRISVYEYIIIYILFKFIAVFTISMILTLIAINTKNTVSFFGISAFILMTEGILYQIIEPLSIYSVFRYINIISFTKVNDIFCNYNNINFWEYPVPLISTALGSIIIILTICTALSIILYVKKRNIEFRRVSSKLHLFKGKKVHSKLYYAFYKSFVFQKGIFMIILFIAAFDLINDSFVKKYDIADVYYKYYAELLEGEITQETLDFCDSEAARFDEIDTRINELKETSTGFSKDMNELQKQFAPSLGFYPMRERIMKIKDDPHAQVFYDTGYKRAFGRAGYDDDMRYALATMLMCIFLISPLIANDNKYRMSCVINSTKSGKKSYIRRNILIASVYGTVGSIMWIVSYVKLINDYYGHDGLTASIRSITDYNGFTANMTVLQYVAMIVGFRTLFVILSALVMLWISSKCNNITSALLINFAIFALPVIIYLLGAKYVVNLGFVPFLSVNVIINDYSMIMLIVPIIILSVVIIKLCKYKITNK